MDPEVIAQLEEQLREFTEMLSRQNSVMGDQITAMNKMATSMKGATDATNKNSLNNNQVMSKYAEAQLRAAMETDKSTVAMKGLNAGLGTLAASVSAAAGVFGSLTSSLLSAEQGMAKYGKVADSAVAGAEGLAKSIPIVGDALGGLVGVVGKIATSILTDGLKLVDTIVGMRNELVQTSGALPVTTDELIKLANQAGYFGERMQILSKITAGLGTGLATLGTTAGLGATKFMEIANVGDDLIKQYGRLGISQQRLTEMQGMYVKSQEASGLSMQNQTKTASQLRKESLAYVDNMTRLSALTGKQAEQLQAEQDMVAATIQERMEVVKENAEIKRLKAEGRDAEAADIERRQRDRAAFRQQLVADLGPEAATMAMKVIRSGVYDNVSGPLANLGIDFAKYGEMIKRGGIDASEAARSLTAEYDAGVERIGTAFGPITEFLDDEGFKQVGIVGEAVGRGLTRAGKNYEEANDQTEAEIKKRKEQGDVLADTYENFLSQERKFQAMYQEMLLNMVMKLADLVKGIDVFKMVTENLTGILSGLGVAIAGVTALSAGMGIAGAMMAGRAVQGALGLGAGAAGVAGLAGGLPRTPNILLPPNLQSSSLAGRGATAARGAGFLGRASPWISGAMVGKDAYDWATAEGPAKKEDVYGTLGGGIGALIGGGIGFFAGGVGAVPGAAIGAGIGNMIGNWWGGKKDANAAGAAGPAGVAPPPSADLSHNAEMLENYRSQEMIRQREANELYEQQQSVASSLVGTSGSLDSNLEATNKTLKVFRDILEQLNVTLGGPNGPSMGGMGGGNDPNRILATIRQMESGNNYTAQNPTSSASGAYQFIDSTWQSLTKKYGVGTEFKSAKDAPPAIQDQIASAYLQEILGQAGGDISKVPTAWFTGNVQGKSSAVSQSQVASYVQKWMGIYGQMPGGANEGGTIGLFRGLNAGLAGANMNFGGGLPPAQMAGSIVPLGQALQGMGLRVSEHPSFGGVLGKHASNGGHYNGTAIDVNVGTGVKEAYDPVHSAKFDSIANQARQLGYKVLWRTAGHDDHMHIQYPGAERGGILSGPDTGYPAILHGTEMVVPLKNGRTNSSRAAGLLNQLMNTAGERPASVGKYGRIQETLMQVVNSETTKAIKAINETNNPIQNMSTEISMSMRKVMEAHNKTMSDLTYSLNEMIDALRQSNDTTKKILKKAST